MSGYYDDNFGYWEGMDDPDMVDFYHRVQRENVQKVCLGCERKVRIRPDYAYCGPCADKIEAGWDI